MSEPKTAEVKVAEIISDDEIARVHGRADFGSMSPREVVNDGVRKAALGYHSGHTQFCILREHGLITGPRSMSHDYSLTKKGKRYARELMHDLLFRPASPPAETGEGDPSFLGHLIRRSGHASIFIEAGEPIPLTNSSTVSPVYDGPQNVTAQPVSPSEGEAVARDHMAWMRNFVPCVYGVTEDRLNEIDAFLAHPASDQSDTERMRAEFFDGIDLAYIDITGRAPPQSFKDKAWAKRCAALAEKAADK